MSNSRFRKIIIGLSASAGALVLVGWQLCFDHVQSLVPSVIISYGEEGMLRFADITHIHYVGVSGFILVIINSLISWELLHRDHFLAFFLAGSTTFIALLIFMYFMAIIAIQ